MHKLFFKCLFFKIIHIFILLNNFKCSALGCPSVAMNLLVRNNPSRVSVQIRFLWQGFILLIAENNGPWTSHEWTELQVVCHSKQHFGSITLKLEAVLKAV